MASDEKPFYMKELEEKYGSDQDKINRAIRFRANMIMLKMMYDVLLVVVPEKKPIWDISYIKQKGWDNILKTNRTDFSKICNGHIHEATKKMREAVKDSSHMQEVMDGKVLLKINHKMFNKQWEDIFESYDTNGHKEKLDKVKDCIKVWISADGKNSKEDSVEYQCYLWLMNHIKIYVQQENDSSDNAVKRKVQGLRSLTFKELDECESSTIREIHSVIKRVYDDIDCIYKYKCEHQK